MTLRIRRAGARGRTELGWLDSRHSFAFGHYHDPEHMGFGALRVINDDRVAPGGGFAMHPHSDMEIVSYVLDGALAHRDNLGNGSIIRPGEVQRMSAGTGIRHSEFNASEDEPVRFLQIWILPQTLGLEPSYEQKAFAADERRGRLRLVASGSGRDGAVTIHRDVDLYAALLGPADRIAHTVVPGRGVWAQLARGRVLLNGRDIEAGDGVAIDQAGEVVIAGVDDASELLLFDLAM